ncbi:MAG: 50S ribosomal protein L21 [Clostridiales bacterium]|jgi:large subunit ribosomal protein L21|nr:50S ribosomal protein L21 [Clostridiales bacterium]
MYAIIVSGGKQYKAEKDLIIKVEKLDANAGDKVKFDVLLLADEGNITAGNPVVAGAYCEAEVLGDGKGDKIVIYRYKAKKNVRKKQGHRQPYTAVKVLEIVK